MSRVGGVGGGRRGCEAAGDRPFGGQSAVEELHVSCSMLHSKLSKEQQQPLDRRDRGDLARGHVFSSLSALVFASSRVSSSLEKARPHSLTHCLFLLL